MTQPRHSPRRTFYTLSDGEIPLELRAILRQAEPDHVATPRHHTRSARLAAVEPVETSVARCLLIWPWDRQFLKDTLKLDIIDPFLYMVISSHRDRLDWLALIVAATFAGVLVGPIGILTVLAVFILYCCCYLTLATTSDGWGAVLRLQLGWMTLYQVGLYITPPIRYHDTLSTDSLRLPASITSLVQAPAFSHSPRLDQRDGLSMRHSDPRLATGILRGAFLGLWAKGYIQFHICSGQRNDRLSLSEPTPYHLLVDVGNVDPRAMTHTTEHLILRALRNWQFWFLSSQRDFSGRLPPTIAELLDLMEQISDHAISTDVVEGTIKTAIQMKLAVWRSNGMVFNARYRDYILKDVATLQAVADTLDTEYDFIAAEIDRALAAATRP